MTPQTDGGSLRRVNVFRLRPEKVNRIEPVAEVEYRRNETPATSSHVKPDGARTFGPPNKSLVEVLAF